MSSTCTVTPSASSIRARASLRGVRSSFRPQIFATKTRRAKSTVTAGFVKYGVREDPPPGDTSFGFLETYGLDLGGGSIQRETLKFGKGSVAVSLDVLRPLGIVFEDVNGKCVAVEVLDGSNAEKAGVKQGDTLRMCGAVAVGKSRVTVAKWAVEPSLDQRKKGINRKACFAADGLPFANAMDAVRSNGEEVGGSVAECVSLLLERPLPEK
jgi:hypothetical protein